MTRVFNRKLVLRLAGRSAVVLPAVGAAVVLAAGSALAAPTWVITPTVDQVPQGVAFSNVFNAVGARTGTDAWAVGNFLGATTMTARSCWPSTGTARPGRRCPRRTSSGSTRS